MSRQNLLKNPLKLLSVKFSKYLCIPSQSLSSFIGYSKSPLLSNQKFKYSQSCTPFISPVTFHTSTKCFMCKPLPEEDPNQPLVKLTFIKLDGEEVEVHGRVGLTLMQVAVQNGLPLEAACEGQLACTTCHVYVEECKRNDNSTVNPYLENRFVEEEDLLDSASFCKPNSRLSCQLIVSADCENARFRLPLATINFSVDKRKKNNNG